MRPSTSVADVAAISLRPILVSQAVLHDIADPNVVVASAANAPTDALFRQRPWMWPSPRHRALARLVSRRASRAGNVPACRCGLLVTTSILVASLFLRPRCCSRLLHKNFIGRFAFTGRHPAVGRCPLSSHGGSLLFLLPWGGVLGEAWHVRVISLVITAYPRRCFITPP